MFQTQLYRCLFQPLRARRLVGFRKPLSLNCKANQVVRSLRWLCGSGQWKSGAEAAPRCRSNQILL